MEKIFTYNKPTQASTESQINVPAWDIAKEQFNKKDYLHALYAVLDYVNPKIRKEFAKEGGSGYHVPHGSIIVDIDIIDENKTLKITAPFLKVPEKNKIPLMRQVASLNFNNLDLAQIVLENNNLYFEYSCPMALVNPFKIYYIFEEICSVGDKYDDEFVTKFGAERINEPKVTPYDNKLIDESYNIMQLSCDECLEALKSLEADRQFGYAWDAAAITLRKILYSINPQGQLMNDINKNINEMGREDIPFPEVVSRAHAYIDTLKNMSKNDMAKDLYFVETFIPPKRRSSLKNIQENFEKPFAEATKYYDNKDYQTTCSILLFNFYNMYYNNDMQNDINEIVVDALQKTSNKSWNEAAPVLYQTMKSIIDGNLVKQEQNPFSAVKSIFSSLFKH